MLQKKKDRYIILKSGLKFHKLVFVFKHIGNVVISYDTSIFLLYEKKNSKKSVNTLFRTLNLWLINGFLETKILNLIVVQ